MKSWELNSTVYEKYIIFKCLIYKSYAQSTDVNSAFQIFVCLFFCWLLPLRNPSNNLHWFSPPHGFICVWVFEPDIWINATWYIAISYIFLLQESLSIDTKMFGIKHRLIVIELRWGEMLLYYVDGLYFWRLAPFCIINAHFISSI